MKSFKQLKTADGFVIYGYVLLVVMFASIFLGIGRHDGEDRLAAKAPRGSQAYEI